MKDVHDGGSTREEPPPPGEERWMSIAGKHLACGFLMALLAQTGTPVHAQEFGNTPSLGEVARQLRAERQKQKQGPVAVYTNDNLPSRGSIGIGTLKGTGGTKEKEPRTAKSPSEASASKEHGEEYFRSKANKLRSRMELHRRQLAVLQQQLGLAKTQYYPNPQKTLEQESTPAFQTDLDKLRSKIATVEKEINDDQEAMDDLQVELRRQGGDPGWIR
jgi:hypothetical protein